LYYTFYPMRYLVGLFCAWMIVSLVASGPLQFNPTSDKSQDQSDKHNQPAKPLVGVRDVTRQDREGNAGAVASEGEPKAIRITKVPPPDTWYKAYVIATCLLVLVGGVGVRYAIKTLRAINSQGGTMQSQLATMKRQAGILEASVEVAKSSARAAQGSVDMFINKERARIGFEPVQVDLEKMKLLKEGSSAKIMASEGVRYAVTFYGPNPAFEVEGKVIAKVVDARQEVLVSEEKHFADMNLPKTVSSQTDLIPRSGGSLLRRTNISISEAEIASLDRSTSFVHLYGVVLYKDVFDQARETRFHYRWENRLAGTYGDVSYDWGEWVKCGPDDENKCT